MPISHNDPKGDLQKIVLADDFPGNPDLQTPKYETHQSGGTANNPEFTFVVYVARTEYGRGTGSSKKEAEKRAAEDALQRLGYRQA